MRQNQAVARSKSRQIGDPCFGMFKGIWGLRFSPWTRRRLLGGQRGNWLTRLETRPSRDSNLAKRVSTSSQAAWRILPWTIQISIAKGHDGYPQVKRSWYRNRFMSWYSMKIEPPRSWLSTRMAPEPPSPAARDSTCLQTLFSA